MSIKLSFCYDSSALQPSSPSNCPKCASDGCADCRQLYKHSLAQQLGHAWHQQDCQQPWETLRVRFWRRALRRFLISCLGLSVTQQKRSLDQLQKTLFSKTRFSTQPWSRMMSPARRYSTTMLVTVIFVCGMYSFCCRTWGFYCSCSTACHLLDSGWEPPTLPCSEPCTPLCWPAAWSHA